MAMLARGYPGTRRAPRIPGQSGGYRPGFPANDPRPPSQPRKPANFPKQRSLPVEFGKRVPRSPKMVPGWQHGLRIGGKVAGRLVPGLGWALLAYDIWQIFRGKSEPGFDLSGFTNVCGSGGDFIMSTTSSVACPNLGSDTYVFEGTGTGTEVVLGEWQFEWLFGLHRVTYKSAWERDEAGDPPEWSEGGPAVALPEPMPLIYYRPWIDPISLPIGQPVPGPEPNRDPYPTRQPQNPYRSPSEQTQRGPAPHRQPAHHAKPYQRPAHITRVSGTRLSRGNGFHNEVPPEKGTKEKKYIAAAAGGFARLLSSVTEGIDLIDAAYDALHWNRRTWKGRDGKWRPREITPQGKIKAVYDNFDAFDVPQFVNNVVANQIEDMFYGSIGRASAKSIRNNPYYKSPVGWQTGPLF